MGHPAWNKGKPWNDEAKQKMRLAKLGKKHTEEHKKKQSEAMKGKRYALGFKHTQEAKLKIGLASKGNKYSLGIKKSLETIEKWREFLKKHPEIKSKIGFQKGNPKPLNAYKFGKGENSPNWKGGITPINTKIRNSKEYADWRTAVFKRDDYTCQECGSRGYKLQADHIKPFAYFPELRLVLENGRTLCVPCHKLTDTYLWKSAPQVLNKIIKNHDKQADLLNSKKTLAQFEQVMNKKSFTLIVK